MADLRYSGGGRRVSGAKIVGGGASKKGTARQNVKHQSGTAADRERRQKLQAKRDLRNSSWFEGYEGMDITFLTMLIIIVAVGLIMVLSASAPDGKKTYDNSYFYVLRQLLFAVLGFVGMFIIAGINLQKIKRFIPLAYLVCIVLLVAVLIPGLGIEEGGSRRWLNIPVFKPQPSEFIKPVIAMYIAYRVEEGAVDLKKRGGIMKCIVYVGIVAGLLMCETHLSGTIIVLGIAFSVMFIGGMPMKPVIVIGAVAVAAVAVYLYFDPERLSRFTAAWHPERDMQGTGYQNMQSIYAIGSGKLFGLGLGQSMQKYSRLPEPYNDFIFSITCEEVGFIGAVIVIILFIGLIARALKIALSAPDMWSVMTCVGIAVQVALQTILNMGVAVSIFPNTGVSLPFFSYGGASLMTLMFEMGILLNISRHSIKD